MSYTVYIGGYGGELGFNPSSLSISTGESVTYVNNTAGPHNVVAVDGPPGADLEALSAPDDMNNQGEQVTLGPYIYPGTYDIECTNHVSSGETFTLYVTGHIFTVKPLSIAYDASTVW
jgi:plastocyanin